MFNLLKFEEFVNLIIWTQPQIKFKILGFSIQPQTVAEIFGWE